MTQVVVLGAEGMLGRALTSRLAHLAPLSAGRAEADVTDAEALGRFIPEGATVINASAYTDVDGAESNEAGASAINADAVGLIAQTVRDKGGRLIHVSTDYVFDGTSPPYAETAQPTPLNDYGMSKYQAEQAVLAYAQHNVVRIPVLYGAVEKIDESALTITWQQLIQSDAPKMDNWAIRYPTHVDDIANTLKAIMCQLDVSQRGGVFHISDTTPYTKFQLACALADAFGYDKSKITAMNSAVGQAPRPQNCQLRDNRLAKKGILYQRDAIKSLIDAVSPFVDSVTHR